MSLADVHFWAQRIRAARNETGQPVLCPNGHELTKGWVKDRGREPRDCRTCTRVASTYDREWLYQD